MTSILTGGDYDYVKLCRDIKKLKEEYPFLGVDVIGKSTLGKNIFALKIGQRRESVLFAAAFHGSEHITQNICLTFLEEMCYCLLTDTPMAGINLRKALSDRSVIFVPSVNPDGCDVSILGASGCGNKEFFVRKLCLGDYSHFNANIRGVDINHNFDAGWKELKILENKAGIRGPAATRFGGTSPESESETKAICELCKRENIRHATALHTQGEIIYWNFGKNTPPRAEKMAEIMATVSGYALDIPVKIATGGGFKDWFIEKFHRPAFTLEMGMGKNPLDTNDTAKIYLKAKEMLTLNAIM